LSGRLASVWLSGTLAACGVASSPLPSRSTFGSVGTGAATPGTTSATDTAVGDTDLPVEGETLEPTALVTRMSLDLRGIRPTEDELARIEADPAEVDRMLEEFLAHPGFAVRMAWLFNDSLHTAVWFQSSPFRVFEGMTTEQGRAAGWAPLELVRHTVDADLPWSTVVQSTTLPENRFTAAFWGRTSTGGEDWTLSPAPDERPMAGILSSSALWMVYDGDRNNFNRRRANAVARIFTCADLFEREVTFDFDLDPTALRELEDAIRTEPTCTSCHAVLDPLASFMGGFVERSQNEPTEQLARYSPWTEQWYRTWTPPAYFGQPGNDLTDLGTLIAADPRFARCAAQTFAEGLIGRPVEDEVAVSRWTDDFRESGLVVRDLVRSIVQSPQYATADERVLTPEQLAGAYADLVGWEPQETEDLFELMWDTNLRLLAGGTDDAVTLQRNRSVGVGHVLSMTWAARRVAGLAIQADLARGADTRILLTEVDGRVVPSDAELRAQLVRWHHRILSVRVDADAPEIDALVALFSAASGGADAQAGFSTVLEALLRHPRSLVY